ncbi:MAG: hypothetical protein ACRCXC_11700 [Legionella sp.]
MEKAFLKSEQLIKLMLTFIAENPHVFSQNKLDKWFRSSEFDETAKREMMHFLILQGLKLKNALLIQALQNIQPYFNVAVMTLDNEQGKVLHQLQSQTNAHYYTERMLTITSSIVKMTYKDALVSVIERSQSKPYEDNPTVLQKTEFKAYLRCINDKLDAGILPLPFMERFMICDEHHWFCGEIYIDANRAVSLLFLDSLGYMQAFEGNYYSDLAYDFYNTFTIEHKSVFVAKEQRLNEFQGFCSVIAEDDLHHLFTIARYLPPEFSDSGLFGYLESHIEDTIEYPLEEEEEEEDEEEQESHSNPMAINGCKLPLKLMRVMQSTRLIQDKIEDGAVLPAIISSYSPEEQTHPFNKKQDTAIDSARKGVDYSENDAKKLINIRAKEVLLPKLIEYVDEFLQHEFNSKSLTDFEKQFEPYTLAGFQSRMEQTVLAGQRDMTQHYRDTLGKKRGREPGTNDDERQNKRSSY